MFAAIVGILFPAYIGTFRNKDTVESQADIYQSARVTLERIVEDLESAYQSSQVQFVGQDNTIDDRDADSLEFMSTAHLVFDKSQQKPGSGKIAYYASENEDEEALILYRSDTHELKAPHDPGTGGLILCNNLYAINFTYYDEDDEEYDYWDSSNIMFKERLPVRVAVQIEFLDRSAPESPLKFMTSVTLPIGSS